MKEVTQPVSGRFSRSEVTRIDEAIAVFPQIFKTRNDFVRFAVLFALNGSIHDSLVTESNTMLKAREGLSTAPPKKEEAQGGNPAHQTPAIAREGRGSRLHPLRAPEVG